MTDNVIEADKECATTTDCAPEKEDKPTVVTSSEEKTTEHDETKPAVVDAAAEVTPAMSEEERAEKIKEADEIFAAAKKLVADCDYANAEELLSSVLETKCEIFGELAVECREAYILYGKCLLLSVKSTHGLDAVLAQSNKIAAAKQRASESGEGESSAAAEVVAEVDDDESSIAEKLETAWNCLEVARVISQKNSPESVELSDVLMDIGDVSLESSNAKLALEDYAKSLQIRKKLLPNSDRRIAEVYYVMGLALAMLPGCTEKSREHFNLAKASMEERIGKLKPGDGEIEELRGFIKDIDSHIEDLGEPDDEVLAPGTIKDMMVAKGPFPATTSMPEASGPVTNLGVVGTTTRKTPETTEAQPPAKKMRTEEDEKKSSETTEKQD